MKKMIQMTIALAFLSMGAQGAVASDAPDGEKLYSKKCKMCHAIDKKGMGPALNTMNSDAGALRSAITDGKGRMPKFDGKLSGDEINALVAFIQSKK